MWRFLQGMIVGIILVPVAFFFWLRSGKAPIAVNDHALPYEQWIINVPLKARIHSDLKAQPIKTDESTLMAGARIYGEKCSLCHGFYAEPATLGAKMYPNPPALWRKRSGSGEFGVSGDLTGAIYWKIANGIQMSGMPAYRGVLTDKEIWDVSVLLANADNPLPPAAISILRGKEVPDFSPALQSPLARLKRALP